MVTSQKSVKGNYKIATQKGYDNGASVVEFDSLALSMQKTLERTGNVERVITYIVDRNVANSRAKSGNKCGDWFISQIDEVYKLNVIEQTIYLNRNTIMLRRLIGVKNQQTTWKIPNNGIVERTISFTRTSDSGTPLYMRLQFGSSALYKRLIKMEYDNKPIYICNTMDNFCFDIQAKDVESVTQKVLERFEHDYTDDNGEMDTAAVDFGYFTKKNITLGESRMLPTSWNSFEVLETFEDVKINKDAREKLIFVLYSK